MIVTGQKTEAEEEEEEEREEPGGPAPADMTGRGANFSYRQDRLFCEEVQREKERERERKEFCSRHAFARGRLTLLAW